MTGLSDYLLSISPDWNTNMNPLWTTAGFAAAALRPSGIITYII
jgi:hypothetical protein